MRVIYLTAALLGVATAQDLSGVPGCALVCALQAGKAAGCGSGDVKCFCSSGQALSQAQSCVESTCSASDAQRAIAGAAKLCQSVGISPPVVARSSPAAPASAPTAADGKDAAPKPPAKDNSAHPAASSSAAAGSVVGVSTSCVTLSSTVASSRSSAPASSTASQPAVYTGAANQVRGAGAILAGAAAVFAAAL